MIDQNLIIENKDLVQENLKLRKKDIDLDRIENSINGFKKLKFELDNLRSKKKSSSKEFGKKRAAKVDVSDLTKELEALSQEIDRTEARLDEIQKEKNDLLLQLPNLIHESVPIGAGEEDNPVIAEYPPASEADEDHPDHIDLGEKLDIIDFTGAVELAGSRFVLLQGKGARLHRAITSFMLDMHAKAGFLEIYPPFLSRKEPLEKTGQIPDKEEDLYKIEGEDLYLVPTAEVPLINYGKYLKADHSRLPLRMSGFSTSFRKEAGSYGKDIRGMIRVHQFDKVELVSVVHPDNSSEEMEFLRNSAENILRALELPYRVVELCTGDLGFTATKTYDLEVWMPGQKRYREVSSISNTTDFQARRMNFKFKDIDGKKKFVHTLNASGLAVGRTFIAVLENYWNADGTISIPQALQSYTGFDKIGG